MTYRFLATGETFRSLSFSFRMGRTSVARIIKETCYAIWKALQPDYVKMPKTEEEWKAISNGFLERWQLPNCCGSIDGKHVTVQCPQNTGSLNFNYKGRYSKVLIAVADSEYRFIMFEVGFNGSESDGGIFQRCTIGKRILRDKMNLPNDEILPYSKLRFPYFFIGDEAFPLRHNLMRPFPRRSAFSVQEKVYNYRISRARRVVENSFGILVTRFRVFLTSINVHETKTLPNVVAASIALHNFLLKECASTYCPPGYADSEDSRHNVIPGQWREINPNFKKYGKMTTNMYSRHTKKLREAFASYLTKDFPVDWQYRSIYRSNS